MTIGKKNNKRNETEKKLLNFLKILKPRTSKEKDGFKTL